MSDCSVNTLLADLPARGDVTHCKLPGGFVNELTLIYSTASNCLSAQAAQAITSVSKIPLNVCDTLLAFSHTYSNHAGVERASWGETENERGEGERRKKRERER